MAAPSTIKYPDKRGKWRVRARPVPKRGQQAGGRWYWRFEGWLPGDKPWAARPAAWMTEDEVLAEVSRLYLSEEWLLRRPGQETPEGGDGPPVVLWQLVQKWLKHLDGLPDSRREGGISPETKKSRVCSANRLLYKTGGKPRNKDGSGWTPRSHAQTLLGDLSEEMLRAHIRRRKSQEGAADLSIRVECEVMWQATAWGEEKGWCKAVPRFRTPQERFRGRITPTDEQLVLLLPYLKQYGSGWPAIAAVINHVGGLRIGETAHLRTEQVERRTIEVSGTPRPALLLHIKVSKTGPRTVVITESTAVRMVHQWMDGPRRCLSLMETLAVHMAGKKPVRARTLAEELGWPLPRVLGTLRRMGDAVEIVARLTQPSGQFDAGLYRLAEHGAANMPPSSSPYLLGVNPETTRSYSKSLDSALGKLNVERAKHGLDPVPRWTSHGHRRRSMHNAFASGLHDPAAHKAQFGNSWELALQDYVLEEEQDSIRAASLAPDLPELDNVRFLFEHKKGG